MDPQKQQDAHVVAAEEDADQPTEDDFNPDDTDADTDDDWDVDDISRRW
jgi:hypothetical protein